ncbi:hypothetical protein AZI87_16160 [Bdellovibrio bacteriovorus]|uniref:Isochorismatase-like domain-containing protein n=1 Tax=Bdellovibrio bacteriovorus TaxID=959 RepID=A0A162FYT9_BDEBC|nr:isochorismatase family protein [Bdellovibrio bacteriovorus]KYG62808.1 hypothetical protein AZI87_16160 [Bdellovibrio bacteriovorus]
MNQGTALMIVDAQVNMFDPKRPVFEAEHLLERLKKLLSLARASGTQVVFVQNNGTAGEPDEPRTPGWLIHPELEIAIGDLIIQKTECSAFAENDLEKRLKQMGIKKLIIAGLQSEYCVVTNCEKSLEAGFEVILVSDAHSTYDSATQKASEIIASINAKLRDKVDLWRVDDVAI